MNQPANRKYTIKIEGIIIFSKHTNYKKARKRQKHQGKYVLKHVSSYVILLNLYCLNTVGELRAKIGMD